MEEIRATVAETLTELNLDEMILILDDKSSLVDASGIMYVKECAHHSANVNNTSGTTYTDPSTDKLTDACTLASHPAACADSRQPPPTLSHTNQRSIVTLRSTTAYKMAASFLYHTLIVAIGATHHF